MDPQHSPTLRFAGTSTRVLAGSILALGLAVAVLLPNGYACGTQEPVEVGRQWSYSQERFFYGCHPTPETMEALETQEHFLPWMPTDADVDWRIPMRIGAVVVALLIAWAVLANGQRFPGKTKNTRGRTIIALYGLVGATVALLLTLREDSFCLLLRGRAPGSLSCSYRSFFGWDAEPVLVEVLVTMVGAALGAAVGVLVARWARRDQRGSGGLVGASLDLT
jgi:hypothetical protein